MKLPTMNRNESNGDISIDTNSTSRQNGRTPSRTGRQSSTGVNKRIKGESIAQAVAAVTGHNERNVDSPNRYTTMKKVAEEQRRKVRETRERQIDEERQAIQSRRQEELRVQIRVVLENLLVDVRKDIFLLLQERINEERSVIKAEMRNDLQKAESGLVREVEKRVTNGEPFDERVTRLQKEFENSFNKILKSELRRVQNEILNDVDNKIDKEKRRWEENFKREADKRIRAAEDAIRTDFRVGLEDSQKQCNDILTSMQDRTTSFEQKLTDKIAVMDAEVAANIDESQRTTRQIIDDKLNERDRSLTNLFSTETDGLRNEITQVRMEVTQLKSKCCVIL